MKRSTCVYLIQNGQWLMLYRNRKQNDVNHGKWIGVGGKCEGSETFEQCAVREVLEETGLHVSNLYLCGIVDFIYDRMEPEQIAIYTSQEFRGELQDCPEGTLAWIPQEEILNLALWEGDRIFLERMLKEDPKPFHLKLVYDDAGELIEAQDEEET